MKSINFSRGLLGSISSIYNSMMDHRSFQHVNNHDWFGSSATAFFLISQSMIIYIEC